MSDTNNKEALIMNKLNYLEDTKNQLRQALVNKGQTVSTIDTFRSYVQAVNDIQIGTDTSDADATAFDIISPRTAYVNNKKLIGKINKISDEFSFDNYELSQTNKINDFIKDYTMKDDQIFHQEYLSGINLIGKDFLIYMRPNTDESQAIIFTWNNTQNLVITLNNNTMILKTYTNDNIETDTLTTYTDLFLSGTPTKTEGTYSGIYFGNDSYYTTKNIYSNNDELIFETNNNQSYDYFTINQSFDETKAISSEANNKINLEQKNLAQLAGLKPEILKKDETIMGITGNLELGVKLFESEMVMQEDSDAKVNDLALVYSEYESDLNSYSPLIAIKLTENITLDSTISSSYLASFSNSDNESIYINLYKNSLNFNINTGSFNGSVNYSSTDGLNYIFTNINIWGDSYETSTEFINEFKFVRPLKYNSSSFNYHLGYVCKMVIPNFGGIFKYYDDQPDKSKSEYAFNLNYDISAEQDKLTYDKNYIDTEYLKYTLPNLAPDLFKYHPEYDYYDSIGGIFLIELDEEHLDNISKIYYYENCSYVRYKDGIFFISNWNNSSEDYTTEQLENNKITKHIFDLNHWTYSSEEIIPNSIEMEYLSNDTTNIMYCLNYKNIESSDKITYLNVSKDRVYTNTIQLFINGNEQYGNVDNSIKTRNPIIPRYIAAPNQLSLENSYQLLDDVVGYGQNGVVYSDGNYTNYIKSNKFKSTWLPQLTLPNSYSGSTYQSVVYNGPTVNYQSLVTREKISVEDLDDKNNTDNCVVIDPKIDETIKTFDSNSNIWKAYRAFNNRYQFARYNNTPYWVVIGANFNVDKNNSDDKNTIKNLYGAILNLETMEVEKDFGVTLNWRPFNGWGGWSSTDCCDWCGSAGYCFETGEWIATIDTGSMGWSNGAWFAYVKVDDEGNITKNAYNIGSGGRSYHRVNYAQYDWKNKDFYVSIYDHSNSESAAVKIIKKITSSGTISTALDYGSYQSSPNSNVWQYGFQYPVPMVAWYNGSNYYLRSFITNTQIQTNFINSGYYIYDDIAEKVYLTYRDPSDNLYKIISIDPWTMVQNEIYSGSSQRYLRWFNNELVMATSSGSNPNLYKLDGTLIEYKPNYNTSNRFNNTQYQGYELTSKNELITEGYLKTYGWSSSDNLLTLKIQKIIDYYYEYKQVTQFPVSKELYIVLPSGNNIYNSDYYRNQKTQMYNSAKLTSINYDNTITPEEYIEVTDKTLDILGN